MSDTIARLNAALDGRYRIESELGAGGMATVYLADDLRHERRVAVKVLRPELAAVVGPERFLAEIRTTANLQHPHILPLFDSGEADRFLFYVMPYVEGESLRDRLDREHQLPVDDAVTIATKVAGALQAAHEHGVIHRDIKPANILLSKGEPLVSDFGIALAVGVAGGGRLTETGLSLGTPHYMSPEQATGDPSIGAGTDVYALGCVLYEMLVGDPPYTGSTPQAVLGRILTGDADPVSRHRRSVPSNVDAAIRKALEKVPADRFPAVADFSRALSDRSFRLRDTADRTTSGRSTYPRAALAGLAAVSIVLAAVAAWGWLRSPPRGSRSALSVFVPTGILMNNGQHPVLAISHDGQTLAFRSDGAIYLRVIDDFELRRLPLSEEAPFFSHDDEWLTAGEQTLRLVDGSVVRGSGSDWGATWSSDGRITFAEGIGGQSGLWRVPRGGWRA